MYAGRSTQRRNYKSGIVGDHNAFDKAAVVQRFPGGIFRKRWRGFVKSRKGIETRKKFELEGAAGSEDMVFAKLAGVGRSEQQISWRGH